MSNIAQNLLSLNAEKHAIREAINKKGGKLTPGAPLSDYPAAIAALKSDEPTVLLYDYDGTLLHSFSADEFLALEEMPAAPEHEGLTPEGWNWDLQAAQAYVRKYGALVIGMTYVSADGLTRLYLRAQAGGTVAIKFEIITLTAGRGTVDWGDGTTDSFSNGYKLTHTYEIAGEYTATISKENVLEQLTLTIANTNYASRDLSFVELTRIVGGDAALSLNITSVPSLETVSIPKGAVVTCITCTALNAIVLGVDSQVNMYDCRNLEVVSFPPAFRIPSSAYNCFANTKVRIVTLPEGISSEQLSAYMFTSCVNMQKLVYPEGVSSAGTNLFGNCTSLQELRIPMGSVMVDSMFLGCSNMRKVRVGCVDTNWRAFAQCYSLLSVVFEDGLKTIGNNCFSSCYSLREVKIPDGLETLGESAFNYCKSLERIDLPSTVKEIKDGAFSSCSLLTTLVVKAIVPPALSSYVFSSTPADKKIYVPDESVDAYRAAANWSTLNIVPLSTLSA